MAMTRSDQANLVLICGGPVERGTGICWTLAAVSKPADAIEPSHILPADYLDAGIVVAPTLADDTFTGGTFAVGFQETNRVTIGFGATQVRHLIVDVVDGVDRLRWRLGNVRLNSTPGRVYESGVFSWRMTATVAEADVAVTRAKPVLR